VPKDPRFDSLVRANRYFGAALYYGRRAKLYTDRRSIAPVLEHIHETREEPFVGLMPLPPSTYDDGEPHLGDWLLGDVVVEHRHDDAGRIDGFRTRDELDTYFVPERLDARIATLALGDEVKRVLDAEPRFVLHAEREPRALVYGYALPPKVAAKIDGFEVFEDAVQVMVGEAIAHAEAGETIDVDLDLRSRERRLRAILEDGAGAAHAEREDWLEGDFDPWLVPMPVRR